ncbi:STAS domain-containing protein [Mesosutterella sp. AGMB02718]|uniref:STAS domain-containing protein n=1 Tax=Mesosutterella faecium TaxID=2925194 RepID=A0ABT7IK28_9BURK|nr:STAS domain-containing protein [Mesosutterella sp. AGMB02718]MDL2058717.1 STAS domain-containing protein [Mesosutterella sp. AGMB02718]
MKIKESFVTLKNVQPVIAAGDAAIAAGDGDFDFSGVQRGDSSAVACLLHWKRGCQKAGVPFRVKALPAGILDLCRLYEVEELLDPQPQASGTEAA